MHEVQKYSQQFVNQLIKHLEKDEGGRTSQVLQIFGDLIKFEHPKYEVKEPFINHSLQTLKEALNARNLLITPLSLPSFYTFIQTVQPLFGFRGLEVRQLSIEIVFQILIEYDLFLA